MAIVQETIHRLVQKLNSEETTVAEQAATELDGLLYPTLQGGIYSSQQLQDYFEHHFSGLRGTSSLDPLIEILESGTPQARKYATTRLAAIGDPRCRPYLLRALTDSESLVRAGAAEALFSLPDETAIELLITLLEDDSTKVVKKSAHALGRMKAGDATVKLSELAVHQHWQRREAAIRALAYILDGTTLPIVRNAMKDKDRRVRQAARWALYRFDLRRRKEI